MSFSIPILRGFRIILHKVVQDKRPSVHEWRLGPDFSQFHSDDREFVGTIFIDSFTKGHNWSIATVILRVPSVWQYGYRFSKEESDSTERHFVSRYKWLSWSKQGYFCWVQALTINLITQSILLLSPVWHYTSHSHWSVHISIWPLIRSFTIHHGLSISKYSHKLQNQKPNTHNIQSCWTPH